MDHPQSTENSPESARAKNPPPQAPTESTTSLLRTLIRFSAAAALLAGPPLLLRNLETLSAIPFLEQTILGTSWFAAWLVLAPRSVSMVPSLVIAVLGAALVLGAYLVWIPEQSALFIWSTAAASQLSCHGGNLLVLGSLGALSGAARR